jgi:hypothetical protein
MYDCLIRPYAHANKHQSHHDRATYRAMWVVRRTMSDHFCHWPIDIFSLCQCAQSNVIARYSNVPSNSAIALGWGAKPRTMLALVHPALDHRLFSVIADLGHSFELMRAYINPGIPQCPTGHTVMTIYTVPLWPIIEVKISVHIATIETHKRNNRIPQCQTKTSTCC